MSRIPKDILERLSYFQGEVEGLFRRLFADELGAGGLGEESSYPPCDVAETDDELIVRADLPGQDRESISLFGATTYVVLQGSKPASAENWAFLRLERKTGPFQRLVGLPVPGDTARMKASYHQGVLEVRIPKLRDRRRVHRQIPIE